MTGSDKALNIVAVGDIVYFCDTAKGYGRSKKLLSGEIISFSASGRKVVVKGHENGTVYSKFTKNVIKPYPQ